MNKEDYILELDKELRRENFSTSGISKDTNFIYNETFFTIKLFITMCLFSFIIIYLNQDNNLSVRQDFTLNLCLILSPFGIFINSTINKHDKSYIFKDNIFLNIIINIFIAFMFGFLAAIIFMSLGLFISKLVGASGFMLIGVIATIGFFSFMSYFFIDNLTQFFKAKTEIDIAKEVTKDQNISSKCQNELSQISDLKELLILDLKAKQTSEFRASERITLRLKEALNEKKFNSLDEYILALAENDHFTNENENEIKIEVS